MTIGKIAVPEMQKAKYDIGLAGGVMASAGPIAAMIPPSGLMIIYSLVTEQSVARLLMAGFLPGILTASLFALTVFIWTRIKPGIAPATGEHFSFMEKLASLKLVWPIGICAVLIIGGIYTGVFTPTEAGGMASLIVLVVGFLTRRLNLDLTRRAVMDSAKVVGTVMIILVGSLMFNSMFAITGISQKMMAVLAPEGASALLVVTGIMMMYLVLGCFLSAIAMIFLTMPFVFPIILQLGVSPIWFGVLVVHMCEVGSITPPFGITLFAVKAILPREVQAKTLIKGALPFFATYMVVLVILLLVPNIALFLPSLMDVG
jgi:C4-dicarboxylate transporter DctM subunit